MQHLLVLLITLLFAGCASHTDTLYPAAPGGDADTPLDLHSNKDKTTFTIDGKRMATGKRIRVMIDPDRSYTIVAKPQGYRAREFYVQPPYSDYPVTFTFMVEDKLAEAPAAPTPVIDTAPPVITLLSTRDDADGERGLRAKKVTGLEVKGHVKDISKIVVFEVDGQAVALDHYGLFRYRARPGQTHLSLVAVDAAGNVAKRSIPLTGNDRSAPPADTAQHWYAAQYALIVGIDNYANPEIQPLKNAANDARAIARILKKMGYQTVELYNAQATKHNILQEFNRLHGVLRPDDAFLFYFAGHGQGLTLNNGEKVGYILPHDFTADLMHYNYFDLESSAIALSLLRTVGKDLKARHIALFLDSCFAGLLMKRSIPDVTMKNVAYYQKLLRRKAINILTAGDDEPVSDGTGHSPFATALIKALEQKSVDLNDQDGYATFDELSIYVKKKVEQATQRRQRPQFDNLSQDDGSYLFRF